jgi:MinD-like ATPase involved in chromosome partitioning or flagellar assembly
MSLIPAAYVMKQTEGVSAERVRGNLQATLTAAEEEFDYVLLDAQSGSDLYAQVAFEAADETIIVGEFDPISAEGVER